MTFTPIAVYFLYFIFSHPDSQLCTPEDRTQDCSSAGKQPICAIYIGDNCLSPNGICYRTLTNACTTCLDENVIGFTLGECKQPALPQVCRKRQRGLSCLSEAQETPVCGYGKSHLRGKALTTQQFSSGCEACSSEQFVFSMPGECQDRHSLGVCRDHKNKKCEEEQAEPLCTYYIGDDCSDKMCRRTMMNSCNVCQESSSVLFFVKGACSDDILRDGDEVEEILREDAPDDQNLPIPELEAVVQEDGSVLYEEVKPEETGDCYVEPQENIPELEPVVQEDGSVVYEEVKVPEMQSLNIDELKTEIPELEAVLQEDGTFTYIDLKAVQKAAEAVEADCYVEPQENIPELEAVVQEDGSFIYKEVKVPEVQEDELFEPDCVVEVQDYIPELEAVVQADGSIIYEEVEPSQESANEEASILPLDEESLAIEDEKVEPTISTAPVEVIESRLLANEPEN